MELKVLSDEDDVLQLQVVGRTLDGEIASEQDPMAPRLDERGYARRAVLSLADTDYVNSSGLALLLIWHKRFRDAGGKLVVHSIPVYVMETIRILRLELVLNLAEDASTALELVQGDPA